MSQKQFNYLSWSLLAVSIILPVLVWGDSIRWNMGSITLYQLFPLFGLLAWMIMWTHYATGALRLIYPGLQKPKHYEKLTGILVLGALLLHPGMLAFAQFRNGEGVPPGSYYSYVGDAMKLSIIFGVIALLIFLSFEVFNRLKDQKYIKKYWWAISLSQAIAMILIFLHGINLGSQLQSGWFTYVWYLYGIILLPCMVIILNHDFKTPALEKQIEP